MNTQVTFKTIRLILISTLSECGVVKNKDMILYKFEKKYNKYINSPTITEDYMDKYTIYCTAEQTKKALIHHAPINHWGNTSNLIAPTAEQMLGWLRTKGFQFKINESEESTTWQIKDGWRYHGKCATPKEATLAAIDAALDYLSKNK